MSYFTKIEQLVKAANDNNTSIGKLTLKQEAKTAE